MQDSLNTIAGACARLQVSRGTLYKLLNSGELASIHIGRARRVPESAINAFIQQSHQQEVLGAR